MKLTENFDIKEWRCHDGTDVPYNLVDNAKALAVNLQVLRETVGRPVNIISGYRNPSYNKRIGGAKRSYHMKAMAADIRVKGMTPAEVKATIEGLISDGKMEQGGLGLYKSFVHYDNRGRRARWGR